MLVEATAECSEASNPSPRITLTTAELFNTCRRTDSGTGGIKLSNSNYRNVILRHAAHPRGANQGANSRLSVVFCFNIMDPLLRPSLHKLHEDKVIIAHKRFHNQLTLLGINNKSSARITYLTWDAPFLDSET